jgi:hypothetical protein
MTIMKKDEIEPYLQSLREWMGKNGFCYKRGGFAECYVRDFGHPRMKRKIVICIDLYCQYIVCMSGGDDEERANIHNSNFDGKLSINYLDKLMEVLLWKENDSTKSD